MKNARKNEMLRDGS